MAKEIEDKAPQNKETSELEGKGRFRVLLVDVKKEISGILGIRGGN